MKIIIDLFLIVLVVLVGICLKELLRQLVKEKERFLKKVLFFTVSGLVMGTIIFSPFLLASY